MLNKRKANFIKRRRRARLSSQEPIVFYSMSELIYRLVWRITTHTAFVVFGCIALWPLTDDLPGGTYISSPEPSVPELSIASEAD